MHASTIIFLLAFPLLALAAPAPMSKVGAPSGIDITVYQNADCKGKSHEYPNMRYGGHAEDSPASKSYRLSKDLAKDDYLTFGSERPFIPTGKDAKAGCHSLKDEAFFFTFQKSG
ncbi:MAG: hypothetical protein LQ338_007294 [Usnochroma carphineum]|nr:MAG: hypothetical protein LQ338_007294 [Usnochroma carphineum]